MQQLYKLLPPSHIFGHAKLHPLTLLPAPTDDELEGMWAKLQNKYLQVPDNSGSGSSSSGTGRGGTGGSSRGGGVVGAAAATPPPPHVASGAGGDSAMPKTGLLSRLLRTVKAAKERRS